MANKAPFQRLFGKSIPKTDATNFEFAPAYKLSPKQTLAQYAATACFNNAFYADADMQLKGVLDACSVVDSEFIARTAVYAPSVITSKPANGYHFKTGHRTSVRDKSFYSLRLNTGKDVFVPLLVRFQVNDRSRAGGKCGKRFVLSKPLVEIIKKKCRRPPIFDFLSGGTFHGPLGSSSAFFCI